MLNSTLLKTFTIAALLGGSLALSSHPAQASSFSTTQQPLLATTAVATETKQEQAPSENFNPDEIAPINDQELAQFASALMQIQTIQASYDTQVVSVVENVGLSPQRFDQILMVLRAPQEAQAENIPEVEEEEVASFQEALVQIETIQEETRTQMQQAIQAEGLDLERFQEIVVVINNDESLEGRVRQMLEEEAGEQS